MTNFRECRHPSWPKNIFCGILLTVFRIQNGATLTTGSRMSALRFLFRNLLGIDDTHAFLLVGLKAKLPVFSCGKRFLSQKDNRDEFHNE